MFIQINQDLIVVKHEVEDEKYPVPHHCFSVWIFPHENPEMKELLNTFEGDFITARKECAHFVAHRNPVLWIEKEDEIYAGK